MARIEEARLELEFWAMKRQTAETEYALWKQRLQILQDELAGTVKMNIEPS